MMRFLAPVAALTLVAAPALAATHTKTAKTEKPAKAKSKHMSAKHATTPAKAS